MLSRALSSAKRARYVFAFGAARGLLFVSPLILANVLQPGDYGRFEWAHAAATLAAVFLAGGTISVLPLAIHHRVRQISESHIARTTMATILIWAILCAGLLPFLAGDRPFWLVAVFAPVLLLQNYVAMKQKSVGKPVGALSVEAGFFIVATVAVLLSLALAPGALYAILLSAIVLYGALLLLSVLPIAVRSPGEQAAQPYRSLYKRALPLMGASLAVILIFTSGRLALGILADSETVAAYASIYRVTFLPMLGHQLIVTAVFASLYKLELPALDRAISIIPLSVAGLAILLWLILDPLGFLFGPAFFEAYETHPKVALVLVAQIVLLSAISLNEVICGREHIAGKVLPWSLLSLLLLGAGGVVFLNASGIGLEKYVVAHFAVVAGFYLTQAASMRRHGVTLPRTYLICIAGTVAGTAISIFAPS